MQDPAERAARHHRDLLHRPGPGPRRHPLLPLRQRGRRARPTCSPSPAAWPTRPRSPGSTSAAARPSSSATPPTDKNEALLRAYGRFVQSLGGRYYTACDVGTYVAGHGRRRPRVLLRDRPLPRARRRRRLQRAHRVRRLPGHARSGGEGLGRPDPARAPGGRRGRGQGRPPPRPPPRRGRRHRGRQRRQRPPPWSGCSPRTPASPPPPPTRCPRLDLDVYAPCALGGSLDDDSRRRPCRPQIVCGAANNQLAHAGVEKLVADRGILYAPDYLVNAGGLIQVADEIDGLSRAAGPGPGHPDLRHRARGLRPRRRPRACPPSVAADRLAERRMTEVGRLRSVWLPALTPGARRAACPPALAGGTVTTTSANHRDRVPAAQGRHPSPRDV